VFQLPQKIDAGEAIVAVVGIRPLLTKTVERIRAPDWEKIGDLDKVVYRLARDLARGQLDRSSFPEIDYDGYLDTLSSGPDQEQISAMVQQFPIELHDATTAFLGQSARALNYLRTKFPISTYKTVFGAVNVEPSFYAVSKFESVLEIVDRPLAVFEMVDSGRLTSDMALAMMTVYPSLYAAIVGAIVVRCSSERASLGDKFDPHFGRALAVLLAVPGLDPGLRQQLQTPDQSQQQQKNPTAPATDSTAKAMASPSQKLDLNE
jgi:hypothetical protein